LVFVVYAFSEIGEAQLEARTAGFPARLFILPVTTPTLVLWPMLQATAAVAVTWVGWVGTVLWPAGLDLPLGWPAVLSAVVLAWFQALVWWPFPVRFLRLVVIALVVTLVWIGTIVLRGLPAPPALWTAWVGGL